MVQGFQGRPGAGKTAAMVAWAYKLKQQGREVFANVPLVDYRIGAKKRFFFFGQLAVGPANEETFGKPWAGMINNIDEALTLDNALILLDEVHLWLPAQAWADIPFEVTSYLSQQRKNGLDIWYTAQNNGNVFNKLRQLTAILWSCARYGPWSVITGADPETKENYGRRVHWLHAGIWALYDTGYEVGQRDGAGGKRGANRRYQSPEQAALAKLEAARLKAGVKGVAASNVAVSELVRREGVLLERAEFGGQVWYYFRPVPVQDAEGQGPAAPAAVPG
jgi:hypothetical protein